MTPQSVRSCDLIAQRPHDSTPLHQSLLIPPSQPSPTAGNPLDNSYCLPKLLSAASRPPILAFQQSPCSLKASLSSTEIARLPSLEPQPVSMIPVTHTQKFLPRFASLIPRPASPHKASIENEIRIWSHHHGIVDFRNYFNGSILTGHGCCLKESYGGQDINDLTFDQAAVLWHPLFSLIACRRPCLSPDDYHCCLLAADPSSRGYFSVRSVSSARCCLLLPWPLSASRLLAATANCLPTGQIVRSACSAFSLAAAPPYRDSKQSIPAQVTCSPLSRRCQSVNDLCTAVKLDVPGKDQHSVSTRDPKIFSTHSNKLNDASVSNDSSIVVKHIPSEESEIPDTLLGKTCKGIQLEKDISNEAPEHVKNVCLEAHGSHNSLNSDNVKSLQLLKNDLVVEGCAKREPEIVKYDVSEKIESHLDGKNDSEMLKKSIPTRGLTPQRRPRSSSPGSDPDRMNKRIASVCVFYARGWCIKGKSCKFLHQKDGDSVAELQVKEDSVDYNKKSDTLCTTGSKDAVEGAHVSSALLDSNPEVLLGSNSHLQRALVRTYGAGSHVPSNLHERYDMHTRGEFRKPVHFQPGCTSTQEEYRKPFGKMSYFESVLERQSDDALLSRRHMIDGKLLNDAPRDGSPYERTISRTHLVDAFAPESKHYLDNSSISSILHQKSNSPSTYGRTEGNGIRSARSYFPSQEPYNSHSLSGSLNSGFSGSFPLPQLDYRLPREGMTSTFESSRNTEYLDGHNSLDFDRRYHRDSSPNYLQSEQRNRIHHHNISGDWTSRQTNDQYNTWEPSRPFRPSLAIGTKSLSSPASQYDPILDSIEPSGTNARDNCFSTPQMTSFQDASFYPMKTDSWEGELAKNASLHDSNAHAASDIFFDSSKLDVGNSSLPNYEKVWNPDVLVDKSDIKEAELGSEWRNLDKNRNIKESKAYRIFHSALVDFVKELLKPYWRDGQVSKDSHKTIVKKSVEKVLSALQSHQVPSTQEAINQYLAGSKPKLLKLVDVSA
ncbi:Zinc finger CCCH domain-containing protein 36 [Platanthera guangdongensis]|uniref:Zinc finger CCCH domain-containing protein 36 n=1 Tax=Platanthera guangdongensis TaxID=2320717 RepID=A0ABR2MCM6_9ASPA